MSKTVRVDRDGETESLEVSFANRYKHERKEPVETGWNLEGLDPSDTELLDSGLKWFSGSLAGPSYHMDYDGPPKFPSVYVPDEHPAEIEVLEDE